MTLAPSNIASAPAIGKSPDKVMRETGGYVLGMQPLSHRSSAKETMVVGAGH